MTKQQQLRAESARPKDLHFRKECEDWKCGAHASWMDGYQAAVEDAKGLVETLKQFSGCETVVAPDGRRWPFGVMATEALRKYLGEDV